MLKLQQVIDDLIEKNLIVKSNSRSWIKNKIFYGDKITIDSRQCHGQSIFFPLKGEKADGHSFLLNLEQYDYYFYCPETLKTLEIPEHALPARGIAVKNTLETLQEIAHFWRTQNSWKIAAITGSNGKTTCKDMLHSILSNISNSGSTKGNYNNEIGLPLTLLGFSSDLDFAVLEMGARHLGDIKGLCKIADPNVSCCLNVGDAHIGEFGSYENLLKTKSEIFSSSPLTDKVICFFDQQDLLNNATRSGHQVISFGRKDGATVQIVDEQWINGLLQIQVKINGERYQYQLRHFHQAYSINSAAAIAIALALGLQPEQCFAGLKNFEPKSNRFHISQIKGKIYINDCYNANTQSMLAGLNSCRTLFPEKDLCVVVGDMLELGQQSKSSHELIGETIAHHIKPSQLICIGKESEHLFKKACENGLQRVSTLYANVDKAIESIGNFSDHELYFFKASNGINLQKLVDKFLAKEAQ